MKRNPFPACPCPSFLSTSLPSSFLFTKKTTTKTNNPSFLLGPRVQPIAGASSGGHQNGSHDYHRFNTSVLSGRSPAGPETDPLEVPIKSFGLWSQGKKEGKEALTMCKKKPNKECPAHERHGANGSDSHPADILLWPHVLVSGTQVTGTEGCVWSDCC